jgi:hypothetical protein
VITRSDNPPLTAEKAAARRWLVAIVVVVVVFAVAYYFFALHAAAERDARRKVIQTKIDAVLDADRMLVASDRRLEPTWKAFNAELDAARAAAKVRHDNSVGSNPSDETALEYAEKESEHVDAASQDFQAIKDGFSAAEDIDEKVLGSDAVQKYREDAQAYTTAQSIVLGDWSRAISMIVDDEKISARDGTSLNTADDSDIEHDYQMSDEQTSKANSAAALLSAEMREVNGLRYQRLHQLRTDLAAIK